MLNPYAQVGERRPSSETGEPVPDMSYPRSVTRIRYLMIGINPCNLCNPLFLFCILRKS